MVLIFLSTDGLLGYLSAATKHVFMDGRCFFFVSFAFDPSNSFRKLDSQVKLLVFQRNVGDNIVPPYLGTTSVYGKFRGRIRSLKTGMLYQKVSSSVMKFTTISEKPRNRSNSFLNMIGLGTNISNTKKQIDVQVTEIEGSSETNFCSFKLPTTGELDIYLWRQKQDWEVSGWDLLSKCRFPALVGKRSLGLNFLSIHARLSVGRPSFYLQNSFFVFNVSYRCGNMNVTCFILCCHREDAKLRVRPVEHVKVSGHLPLTDNKDSLSDYKNFNFADHEVKECAENDARGRSISVLLSRPVFAMEFNFMKMQVEAPAEVSCGTLPITQ
ncbi:hypothetical protein GIB67_004011 [Kingdonia uniflora]|uniref:Uncharacterized protein n=1 Tax=Kingdonia uniflora TaxID=39325 RepID=A0A7J7NR26_9MAGN|nr:hypothetical protein GIB67_004011 [Kingdonia uniflora]